MNNADHIPTLARNAVFIADRRPVTTSQIVAEVFGKSHKDVLRAIRDLDTPPDFSRRNFAPAEYTDAQGKKRPADILAGIIGEPQPATRKGGAR